MAHNLNYNEKRKTFSMYSRKEVPWHGLGQFVNEAKDAEEALRMANLDYEVKAGDVFCSFIPKGCKAIPIKTDGKITSYKIVPKEGNEYIVDKKGASVKGFKALYRDDNKHVFGIVTNTYEIVQNYEALDVIYNIVKGPDVTDKNQIVIETAGCLNEGETIFVTAKMPSYMINVKGGRRDDIDRYIVFTSSHDKSSQVSALITNIRVVCNNTLTMALQGTSNKVSLRHTRNIRDKFDQFGELLGVANKYAASAKEVLESLASKQITKENVEKYVFELFMPVNNIEIVSKYGSIEKVPNELISTRMKNKVQDVLNYVDTGVGQEVARGTAYWLYNGVTSYINNGVDYKTGDNRFDKLMNGSANNLLIKAQQKIMIYG